MIHFSLFLNLSIRFALSLNAQRLKTCGYSYKQESLALYNTQNAAEHKNLTFDLWKMTVLSYIFLV